MATKKLYGAFFGPYEYEDDALIEDPDSEFPDMYWDASVSNGLHLCAGIRFLDTDQSDYLTITWDEDDSASRTLGLNVAGGNRSFTLNENFTIGDGYAGTLTFGASGDTLTVNESLVLDGASGKTLTLEENLTISDGTDVVIASATQANTLTLNESFTIGDGSAGTLTFGSVCALTVELASVVNQDLTTDAGVTFATVNSLTLTAAAVGFTIAGGTTSKTLTVDETESLTSYHTDARAATWLAANHETTYNHGNYDTAYGWGDHASGGYLKADGSVALSSRWDMFADIATDRWDDSDTNTFFGIGVCSDGNLSGAVYNCAFGNNALRAIVGGDYNMAVGTGALGALTSGAQNVAIGHAAGDSITSGSYNMLIGANAGGALNQSSRVVAIGYQAMYSEAAATNINSIAIGYQSAYTQNSGLQNVAIGTYAQYYNVDGSYNVSIGGNAGGASGAGSHSNDTCIGYKAGFSLTTGGNNVCIGCKAGDIITSGTDNIIIGYNIDPSAANANHEINIGGVYKGDTSTTVPQFGTHAAIGVETITGYITVKDLAGNDRKLAVVS